MRICKQCGKEFKPYFYVGIHRITGASRRRCYECNPYDPMALATKFKNRNVDGYRQCRICGEYKPLDQFSRTNRVGNLSSYCKLCSANKHKSLKQRFKIKCVEYKGGKCVLCGYDKCPAAFAFHHRDPSQKEFSIREVHSVVLSDKIKLELDKCDLVCANCHAEIHYESI